MGDDKNVIGEYLEAVARPIATGTVEFADKLAVGTGAALVLIVSELGSLVEYIPASLLFVSAMLALLSLLLYMKARYCALQATVIADAKPALIKVAQQSATSADPGRFIDHAIAASVWPATWAMKYARWKTHGKPPINVVVLSAQKVTRYVALQVVTMFAAVIVLFGSFTLDHKPAAAPIAPQAAPAVRSDTPIPSCVDCANRER